MASVILIGEKWRAQVSDPNGKKKRITKTFKKKKDADTWAAVTEAAIAKGETVGITGKTGVTLGEVFDTYLEEVRGLGRTTINVLKHLKAGLGHIKLEKLTSQDIVKYVAGRNYSPASAQIEMSILGTVLKMAKIAWKYHVPVNVMSDARESLKMMKLIGKPQERDRRPTDEEITKLCAYFSTLRQAERDDYQSISKKMPDLIAFAIASTRRAGEITRIRRTDYNAAEKTYMVRDVKHPRKKKGNHKTFPLTDEAIAIIEKQPRNIGFDDEGYELIFPFKEKTISSIFPRACAELGIEDLHFHDFRHEGTSRLFEMGYQIHEVAMFTGHEDWKMLKRYTQLKAKNVRRLQPKAEVVQIDEKRRIKELESELAKLKKSKAA
jgi:integrase